MSRSVRRLPRTALTIGLAAFLALAGTGVASALWSATATPVTGSVTAGSLTFTQTGSAALAKTYLVSDLVAFAPLTVKNTGTVPNTFTLRVAGATTNNLTNAITLSGWSVVSTAACTQTPPNGATVLAGPSLTTGITFAGAQLATGASAFYCIETSVLSSQTNTVGAAATVMVVLSSAIGNWTSNSTTNASQQVQPDTTAPTAPSSLAASGTTGSQTTLTWTASTDNGAVTGYDVYRSGIAVSTVTGTTFTDIGLTRDTAYSYTVKAHDAAGNVSAASNIANVTTLTVAAGSTYQISNPNSGLCIDAGASGAADGTPLVIYGCSTARVQTWQFLATTGGYYEILASPSTTLAWDFDIKAGPGQNNGRKAQLSTYGGGASQQWQAVSEGAGTGKVHFVNLNSGKCLNVPNATTVSGTQLQQFDCNGTVAQTFVMTQVP
ncbi:MAG: mannan endo,4-beta-mannosidase (beta-mannanase) (1,4-beta-d-mannan mannanohydrolase) [Microbacteriaceae bacterium]|nr:mannan endo,4-beta-mannosidase (beta-mannanase) (1,4-beta-d-mannan mannanohydrolase) [Microbacteriaceae bacterium]